MIKKDNFKEVLNYLEFKEDGETVWQNGDFKVDFQKEKLIYPEDVKIHGEFTTTFKDNENFVVFEAVFRLIKKGYKSEHIELEPKWKVGHGASGGRADILVRDNDGKALLIVECKTSGKEFKKAWSETETEPTQIFSYFQQERDAKFLALYTADFADKKVISNYYLINVLDNEKLLENNLNLKSFKDASTVEEIYKVWSETYEKDYSTLGLFENNRAYEIGKSEFSLEDLKEVSSRDIQGKYHEFATILRQHSISGREQAFDRLVNLFLCKVTDERENSEKLDFFWKGRAYDNPFDFQDRLQRLYKSGMKKFLGEDITYIENFMVDEVFGLVDLDKIKVEMKRLLKEQKFFTNNDFAFIDVHNEKLFYQNFEVLLKVARIIQDISLTGSEENQFLGDMFEGFLDSGVKQTEGQFFTPMPIVKFIIHSLPTFEKPKVIDYACGSGHFLNEYASINREAEIFGIEKEYRLSKVAKVSSFMYGSNIDIVFDDGLKKHEKIKDDYFNVLIANPPYSVKGFLENLSEKEREDFELYSKDLNLSSNNAIETFFIERAKQLLDKDGVAGIIVPSSILNKGNGKNIYVATREIILKYFDIVAIAEFGSGTFGKTGTNTVTLFLRRKSKLENMAGNFKELSEKIFNCKLEFEKYFEEKNLLEKYCSHIGIDLEIYKSFLCNKIEKEIFENETFKEYKDIFEKSTETKNRRRKKFYKEFSEEKKREIEEKKLIEFMKEIEKDKFYFFALADKNRGEVLIVKSPSKNSEIKKFLGYEWSSAKGNEGIKYYTTSSVKLETLETEDESDSRVLENFNNLREIDTVLYNPQNVDDESKINTLIRDNFNGEKREIPENLKEFVSYSKVVDMLDFSKGEFDKTLNLEPSKKIEIETKWDLVKLGEIISENQKSKIKVKDAQNIKNGTYKFFTSGENIYSYDNFLVDGKNIYLSTGGNAVIKFYDQKASYSTDTYVIKSNDENRSKTEFIFNILNSVIDLIDELMFKGVGLKHLQKKEFRNIKIPLPPLKVQEKIVSEIGKIDDEVVGAKEKIEELKSKIENEIMDFTSFKELKSFPLEKLVKIPISSGLTPLRANSSFWKNGTIPWVKTEQLGEKYIYDTNEKITNKALEETTIKMNPKNTISIAMYGEGKTRGSVSILKEEMTTNQACCNVFLDDEKANYEYVYYFLKTQYENLRNLASGVRHNLNTGHIKSYLIPLPPLETQNEIVSKIEKIEKDISILNESLENSKPKKQAILEKYLK
jgi:type I restriction enzyme M protein